MTRRAYKVTSSLLIFSAMLKIQIPSITTKTISDSTPINPTFLISFSWISWPRAVQGLRCSEKNISGCTKKVSNRVKKT